MSTAVGTPLVKPLAGRGADPQTVGGKAAAIDRLIAAGTPVPASVALTVAAYRAFVAHPDVDAALTRLACDHDTDGALDPGPVDEIFLAAPMPESVATAVRDAGRAVRRGSTEPTIVVRSSATAEDLTSASFAGQYRSVLGVETDADLERAVRLVWASLWHPAPRFYRRLQGLDDRSVAMAVLVMRQVPASTSGVVFTVDPGGHPECARVETVDGLADGLVSGTVTPSGFVVPRRTPCPQLPHQAQAALAEGLRLADVLQTPLDVEWAHDGRQLWVVQARPITTVPDRPRFDDGFDTRIEESTTYTTSGIAEVLPGVLPPLAWTTAGPLLEDSLQGLLDAAGAASPSGPLVSRIRGRAALDFTRLGTAVDTLPTGARDELEQQYFAAQPPTDVPSGRRHLGSRHDLRALVAQHRATVQAEICIRAIYEVLATQADLATCTDETLLVLRARVLDLARRTAATQAIVAAAAVASQARLHSLLAGWFDGGEAAEIAQSLVADAGEAGTLNGVGVIGLTGTALMRAATMAGSRSYVGGPTWAEAPDMVELAASASPPEPERQPLEEVEHRLTTRQTWRTTRILTGQVVDIRLSLLRRAVSDARHSLARRERAKAALLRLGGLVRRVDLELGTRLAAAGLLEQADDVELLSAAELAGASAPPTRLELMLRRRRLLGCEAAGHLPHVFTGYPHAQTQVSDHACSYSGWGAGPGVAEGPARVVSRPDPAALDPGDVLVAVSTDASWTPLFASASALVVQEGGPLSHAAICARELGLPAVVNVPGIVDRLRHDEHRLRVDGSTGTVTLLDHTDDTPAPAREARQAGAHAGGDAAGDVTGDRTSDSVSDRMRDATSPRATPPAIVATLDDLDTPSATVFVPAVMGLGVIVSLAVGLTSVVQRVMGEPGTDRRSRLHAHQSARVALAGEEAALRDTTGLRSRRTYLLVGLGLVALGLYIGIGEIANYFRIDGYLWMTAWVLAAILMCTLFFEVAGALTLSAALHYDRPPPAARSFLAAALLIRQPDTPRGRSPPGDGHHAHTSREPRARGRMLDHEAIDAAAHRRLRAAARVASAVALLGAAAVAVTGGIAPRNPQFATYQTPILLALMVVFTVSALVALRWEGIGGAVMLVVAAFVGVLAATEYTPAVAFAVFAVLALPAVLHLLGWQRTRSLLHVLVVATVVAATAIAGGVAALSLHAYGFGPTHPTSLVADQPVDVVEWAVAGATTSTSTTVTARLAQASDEAWLLVSPTEDLAAATRVGPVAATSRTDRVATFVVGGLEPSRTYHYGVEADGRVEQWRRGEVTTFPAAPASFTFAFSSCAQTGSNGAVYDAIRASDPLFYIATGDMYYGDVRTDDPAAFAQLFTTTWTSPAQSALYRSTTLAYTWDDHDYDGNDADRTAASRPAALAAYRTYVPHYPFVLPGTDAPIAQAFSVGRVRVVLSDLRSARSPAGDRDDAAKSMLGVEQREWLLREVVESSRTHALVVWISASPWIVPEVPGDDTWGGYSTERRLLSDAIEQAGVTNLLMLSGDAHMVAIDDGSHNTFSTSGKPLFPVFQAAPLDRPAGTKGGPYSQGVSAQPGQFGLVQVEDDGAQMVVSMVGRSWDGDDVPVSWTWRVPSR